MITYEELKKEITYNPETGIFTWNVYKPGTTYVNKIAGSIGIKGYKTLCLKNKSYIAHRIAWLYMTGNYPTKQIDHINGIKDDNRWCNLREANARENKQNQHKSMKNNKSGFLGVNYRKETNKYRSRIRVDGVLVNLGQFDTAIEAHNAYLKAKKEMHPFAVL